MLDFILLYLDPGTGSLIVQALIAGFLALAFYFKMAKNAVTDWVLGLFGKKRTTEEELTNDETTQ